MYYVSNIEENFNIYKKDPPNSERNKKPDLSFKTNFIKKKQFPNNFICDFSLNKSVNEEINNKEKASQKGTQENKIG